MRRYTKYMGTTLRQKVDELLAQPHHDAIALYEELALSRSTLIDALAMFEVASASTDNGTRALAASCVRSAVDHVRDMCLAISRIEKESDEKVSIRVVDLLIHQVIRVVQDVCPDHVKELEQAIRERVLVPDLMSRDPGAKGTTLTPDEAVREMDALTLGEADDSPNP